MFKKFISKKIIIIASVLVVSVLLCALGIGLWIKSKKAAPKIMPVTQEQEERKEPEIIFRNLPPEVKEQMVEEAKKIRAVDGKVQSIKGRILKVKVGIGELKDKVYQINVLPNAKIGRTEVDKTTFVPTTVDSSFDKIKVGDKIIAWAKEDNIRDLKQFNSEQVEVMVEE